MALSNALTEHLQTVLSEQSGENVLIIQSFPISGGFTNKAYRLQSTHSNFFIKFNDVFKFPDMFAIEAAGLRMIEQPQTIKTPKVISCGNFKKLTYLLMEWIEPGPATTRSMQLLGQQLAAMHCTTAVMFGTATHALISGGLPQSNNEYTTWEQFFIQERLQPKVKLAVERGALTFTDSNDFENLYKKLASLFPVEPPALVHGDLWRGNCVIDNHEQPYLVDPTAHYGYREVDIAMTTLFGGFEKEFYEAYQEVYPLQKGWEERVEIWNLYPLLILVSLGGDFQEQIRKVLKKYS